MDELEQTIWEALLGLHARQDEVLEGVMGKTPTPGDAVIFSQAFENLRRREMIVPTICDEHGQKFTAVTTMWYDTQLIRWDGDGWYQLDLHRKARAWRKVYVICHSNTAQMRYIQFADCFMYEPK